MMVKILATADWQLDMRAHRLNKRAKDMLYDARLKALDRLLKLGEEHQVNAILAAGDLFEVANPRKSLISDVARILHENNTVDVHIIPGNHDLCGHGSVWSQPELTSISHLHIHDTYNEVDLGDFVLHPLPVHHKHELEPYDGLLRDVNGDDRIHVVMAHAHDVSYMDFSSSSHEVEAKLPIDTSNVKKKGYDLCILGHWHSWTEVQDNALYPGTHEQTKFGEREAGYVALVELEKGQLPSFTKLKTGQLIWKKEELDIEEYTEDMLIAKVDSIREDGCDFLQLTLTGEADLMFLTDTIPRFEDAAQPRFGFLEIDVSGIRQTIDIAAMQEKISLPPMLNSVQEDILNEIDSTTDESRLTHLQAELVEFWRCLRDSGLMEEVN